MASAKKVTSKNSAAEPAPSEPTPTVLEAGTINEEASSTGPGLSEPEGPRGDAIAECYFSTGTVMGPSGSSDVGRPTPSLSVHQYPGLKVVTKDGWTWISWPVGTNGAYLSSGVRRRYVKTQLPIGTAIPADPFDVPEFLR